MDEVQDEPDALGLARERVNIHVARNRPRDECHERVNRLHSSHIIRDDLDLSTPWKIENCCVDREWDADDFLGVRSLDLLVVQRIEVERCHHEVERVSHLHRCELVGVDRVRRRAIPIEVEENEILEVEILERAVELELTRER